MFSRVRDTWRILRESSSGRRSSQLSIEDALRRLDRPRTQDEKRAQYKDLYGWTEIRREGIVPMLPSSLSIESFRNQLRLVDARVSAGKGKFRHQPAGENLEDGNVWETCKLLDRGGHQGGLSFLIGQADKKIREYLTTGEREELQDAIAHLAFALVWDAANRPPQKGPESPSREPLPGSDRPVGVGGS